MVPLLPGIGELLALDRNNLVLETYSQDHQEKVEQAYRVRGTRNAFLTFIRRQYTIDGLRLLGGTYEDIKIPVLQLHGTRDQSQSIDSARELSARLADLLGRAYLVNPQVDLSVREYRSQWVMVSGEVSLAGRVYLRGGTRLKEVLSEAGVIFTRRR